MDYKKLTRSVLVVLLAAGVMAGCQGEEGEEDNSPLTDEEEESVEVRPEVVFAESDDQPIYTYVESQGIAEPNEQITISPRISGHVTRSNMIEGQHVEQGDTLLQFAEEELALDLQETRNQLMEARQEYDIQKRSENWMSTYNNEDLERNDEAVRIASGLAQAELNMKRIQMQLARTTVTAPISGILSLETRVSPGAYVSQGTELGTLINDNTLLVRVDVLEAEVLRINEDMQAEVTAPGGIETTGQVLAVSPMVNSDTKTGEVIVEIDNPNSQIRPGMTVGIRILVERHEGKVRIPRSAILSRDGGRTLLFKLNPSTSEAEWVYVQPEYQNREWVIVNHEDIAPGDTIAVDQHFDLSHLQVVTPMMQMMQIEETEEIGGN